jgi:KDO2-lipid IV(A) lauroyltransferase
MRLKYKTEYLLFTLFAKLFHLIGLSKTRQTTKYLACFLYYVIPIRKRIIHENLKIAFPLKTEAELKKLSISTYRNILLTFFELMSLPFISKSEMESSIEVNNLEELKEIANRNKGLIILTGHLGGWEMGIASLSLKLNKQFYVLAKQQSNPLTSDWIMEARKSFGNKIILLGVSVRHLYQKIKEGAVVGIGGDQRGDSNGPRFNFFGKSTALHTGTATIALKTNCPVVNVTFIRQHNYSYKVYWEKLSFDNLPADNEGKIFELTQRYISFLEKYIANNPDQYFWMHKIWKY